MLLYLWYDKVGYDEKEGLRCCHFYMGMNVESKFLYYSCDSWVNFDERGVYYFLSHRNSFSLVNMVDCCISGIVEERGLVCGETKGNGSFLDINGHSENEFIEWVLGEGR